ncbi:MAG: hypothetical protein ACM3YE_01390 [Bacteroidota bacterium]
MKRLMNSRISKKLIATYITVVTGLLLLTCIRTYALDWKKYDATVVDKSKDGSKTILTLKDKKDQVFKVVYQDETMLDKVAPKIVKYKNEFYGWREISFTEISFMVFDNFLEVIVMPQEIKHKNSNLATAVPAGITMVSQPDQEQMHYDFRIIKDNLFLRIDGDYLNEGELTAKLRYAFDYPEVYLKRSETTVANSGSSNAGVDEKTRQALIYLLNEDWNGRHQSVPPETIQKVVQFKQNNPWMTKSQLWNSLKKEKVKLTKRELELILIIYFNEFEF